MLLFLLIGEPHKRGFFCDDESLMHPYHKSTVKHWMLFVFGIILPIVIVSRILLLIYFLLQKFVESSLSFQNDRRVSKYYFLSASEANSLIVSFLRNNKNFLSWIYLFNHLLRLYGGWKTIGATILMMNRWKMLNKRNKHFDSTKNEHSTEFIYLSLSIF